MDQQATDGSRVWQPVFVEVIARSLPPNEVAGTLRLVDKAASQLFENCKTLRLSLPSPAHVFLERWGSPDAYRGLSRWQRLKLLRLTAASGSIVNLEVALANAGLLLTVDLLEAAAEAGQLEACKWLRERGCPWGAALPKAARAGHRHVFEWLLDSGCRDELDRAELQAARGGHEGLLHWLRQKLQEHGVRRASVNDLLSAVAEGCDLAALQRLHPQLLAQNQQRQGGYLFPLGLDEQAEIVAAAAGSSTPDWRDKVEWLEGLGYPRTDAACRRAAASPAADAVDRLQWLCGRGYPVVEVAAVKAAESGNLASLRFLMEQQGVRPTERVSRAAAGRGQLAVLQYLHASGSPLSASDVAWNAARGGHLPVVVWAVEAVGGVYPDTTADLLYEAAMCDCEGTLEWLVEEGCPFPADGAPYFEAASGCDLATVRCLHRLGCPWGQNLLLDCIRSHCCVPVASLRRLVELGCPVDWDAAVTLS